MKKVFLLLILTSLKTMAQPKVLVLPIETNNINQQYKEPATKILASFILETKRYTPYLGADPSMAKTQNFDFYVQGSINRLFESVIVELNLFDAQTDILSWSGKVKISTPDELDKALYDLTKAMGVNEMKIEFKNQGNIQEAPLPDDKFFFGVSVGTINQLTNFSNQAAGFGIRLGTTSKKSAADIRFSSYFGDRIPLIIGFGLNFSRFLGKVEKNKFGIGGGLEFGRVEIKEKQFDYFLNQQPVFSDFKYAGVGMIGRLTSCYKLLQTNTTYALLETGLMASTFQVREKVFLGWFVELSVNFK